MRSTCQPSTTSSRQDVLRKFAFFNFSAKWFGARAEAKLPKGWEPDASVLNQFHDYLKTAEYCLHGRRLDRQSHLDRATVEAGNVRDRL